MKKWMMRHIIPPSKKGTPGLVSGQEGLTKILNTFPEYFLFSFVRNPYDRFVSIYNHSVRGVTGKCLTKKYYERPLCPDLTIHEYAELIRAGHWDQLSQFDRYHTRPQISYLPDFNPEYLLGVRLNNQLRCSFIGRFERMEEDWNVLRETLGFPDYPFFSLNSDDVRISSEGVKKHYSNYYDERLKLLVEEIYADDIKQFGYGFEEQGTNVPANIPEPLVQDCLERYQSVCADLKPPHRRYKIADLYRRCRYLFLYRFPTLARLRRKRLRRRVFRRLRYKVLTKIRSALRLR